MTNLAIAHQRLHNQHIAGSPFENPVDAVRYLVAVQAQDYPAAKWALGLRLQGATDDTIEQAFTAGTILRTHLMRPTWHFVTPADIRWLLALTAPRVHTVNAYMYRKLELDPALLKRSNDLLAKALQGGKQLTRNELRDVLHKADIAAEDGLRMSYFMMAAELDGVICSGPRRGKQFTYALLDERAPQTRTLERDEALAELASRYFISRGPATVHDFAKWSGLTITDGRLGLEGVKDQLQHETIDGQDYWFSAAAPPDRPKSPTAWLLSVYDEYVSGYKDHTVIANPEIGLKLFEMGNALSYIIVVNGQIIGTFRRTLRKDAVIIETNFFTQLTEAENEAVVLAAHQFGAFLGLPVVMG